jgi:methionyl-tRNA synthetase
MVIADIIKRWQVLLGNDARLLTGTDEHGMKVKILQCACDRDVC